LVQTEADTGICDWDERCARKQASPPFLARY
jgi:hypothetical protein